jgi:4-hydroxy-tetrahydrodipicolinate synthase
MPAITTCFDAKLGVDYGFMAEHSCWMVNQGCSGMVVLGSLGEGATLTMDEKLRVIETCVHAVGERVPVVAAISALSTREAIALAKTAAVRGCNGLMVLPPYVYQGDWREIKAHVAAVLQATTLPCMLYNNPIAYGTDFLPQQIAELATEYEQLSAVKESSGDARRVAAIRARLGSRLQIFVGLDDAIVEGIGVGATGWIAGLVNALPAESVELFDAAINDDASRAWELYRWFLPLLRFDTLPKFVQLIKLVQREVGMGNANVRPPRLQLTGTELRDALAAIHQALADRPAMSEADHRNVSARNADVQQQ